MFPFSAGDGGGFSSKNILRPVPVLRVAEVPFTEGTVKLDALYVSTSTQALLCVLREAQDGVCIATHVGHFDECFRIWQFSDLPPQPPRCQGMSPRGPPPRLPTLRLSACPMKFCPPSSFPGRAKALPPARLKPSRTSVSASSLPACGGCRGTEGCGTVPAQA